MFNKQETRIDNLSKESLILLKKFKPRVISQWEAYLFNIQLGKLSGGAYEASIDTIIMNEYQDLSGDKYFTADTVFLHELIHWTGHSSRLARELIVKFEVRDPLSLNETMYYTEEMIAVYGCLWLTEQLGLDNTNARMCVDLYKDIVAKSEYQIDMNFVFSEALKATNYILTPETEVNKRFKFL